MSQRRLTEKALTSSKFHSAQTQKWASLWFTPPCNLRDLDLKMSKKEQEQAKLRTNTLGG